jgi:choline dehydrogenase-like flavoprotein
MNHLGPAAPGHAMLLAIALAGDDLDAARAILEELLAAPAFTDLVAEHTLDAPGGVHHATSTCRMGDVVDDDGLVDGFANVHAVDASVFPDIPRANTYLPTLMLAERLAARLVRR